MSKAKSALEVYLYVPNIIGYFRIFFCVLSYYYAFSHTNLSVICYFLGAGLDAFDGMAARALDQCSTFGTMLDMMCDRMGTLVLLMVIAQQDPSKWGLCAFLIVLDVVSHWLQMYYVLKANKASHKGSENVWLNFYYTAPYWLFVACSGNELYIMAWYLLGTPDYAKNTIISNISTVCLPIFVYKQIMNVVQLAHNVNNIVLLDVDTQAAPQNESPRRPQTRSHTKKNVEYIIKTPTLKSE